MIYKILKTQAQTRSIHLLRVFYSIIIHLLNQNTLKKVFIFIFSKLSLLVTDFSILEKTLATIKKGEKGRITQLLACDLRPKFLEMGLYEGKEVSLLFKAPFGDPIAICIDDYVLSLRKNEAQFVMIEC